MVDSRSVFSFKLRASFVFQFYWIVATMNHLDYYQRDLKADVMLADTVDWFSLIALRSHLFAGSKLYQLLVSVVLAHTLGVQASHQLCDELIGAVCTYNLL